MSAVDPAALEAAAQQAITLSARADQVRAAGERAELAEKARRDAFVAIARDLPDPEEFAQYLPMRFVVGLEAARFSGLGMRVDPVFVAEMRSWGLVEYGGFCLTAFGLAVRRVVLSWGDDE